MYTLHEEKSNIKNCARKDMPWSTLLGLDKPSDVLDLYYPLDDVFEEIDKRTSYFEKLRTKAEDGTIKTDFLRFSRDEYDLFTSFSEKAAADVFADTVAIYTDDVPCAYRYNQRHDTDCEGNDVSLSIHYTMLFEPYMRRNIIGALDNAIKEAIANHILWQWWQFCHLEYDEVEQFHTNYLDSIDKAQARLYDFLSGDVTRVPRIL